MKTQRERACKECKRLKLKCDKVFPCGNCNKRGCAAICPDGELVTGRGSRFILSGSEQLYEKNCQLTERIRELEIALGEMAKREKEMSVGVDGEEGLGTPASGGGGVPAAGGPAAATGTGAAGTGGTGKKRRRADTGATAPGPNEASGSASVRGGSAPRGPGETSEEEAVHPLLTKEKVQVKSHIDLVNRPRPGGRFEKNAGGAGAGAGAGVSASGQPSSAGARMASSSHGPGEVGRSQGGLAKNEAGSGTAGGENYTPGGGGGGMNPDLVLVQFLGIMSGYHPLFATTASPPSLPTPPSGHGHHSSKTKHSHPHSHPHALSSQMSPPSSSITSHSHSHPLAQEVPQALLTALQTRIYARIKSFIPLEVMGQVQAQFQIIHASASGQTVSGGSPRSREREQTYRGSGSSTHTHTHSYSHGHPSQGSNSNTHLHPNSAAAAASYPSSHHGGHAHPVHPSSPSHHPTRSPHPPHPGYPSHPPSHSPAARSSPHSVHPSPRTHPHPHPHSSQKEKEILEPIHRQIHSHLARRAGVVWRGNVGWWVDVFSPGGASSGASFGSGGGSPTSEGPGPESGSGSGMDIDALGLRTTTRALEMMLVECGTDVLKAGPSGPSLAFSSSSSSSSSASSSSSKLTSTLMALAITSSLDTESVSSGYGYSYGYGSASYGASYGYGSSYGSYSSSHAPYGSYGSYPGGPDPYGSYTPHGSSYTHTSYGSYGSHGAGYGGYGGMSDEGKARELALLGEGVSAFTASSGGEGGMREGFEDVRSLILIAAYHTLDDAGHPPSPLAPPIPIVAPGPVSVSSSGSAGHQAPKDPPPLGLAMTPASASMYPSVRSPVSVPAQSTSGSTPAYSYPPPPPPPSHSHSHSHSIPHSVSSHHSQSHQQQQAYGTPTHSYTYPPPPPPTYRASIPQQPQQGSPSASASGYGGQSYSPQHGSQTTVHAHQQQPHSPHPASHTSLAPMLSSSVPGASPAPAPVPALLPPPELKLADLTPTQGQLKAWGHVQKAIRMGVEKGLHAYMYLQVPPSGRKAGSNSQPPSPIKLTGSGEGGSGSSSRKSNWAWLWKECIIFEGLLGLEIGKVPLASCLARECSYDVGDSRASEMTSDEFRLRGVDDEFDDGGITKYRSWLYDFTTQAITPVLKYTSPPISLIAAHRSRRNAQHEMGESKLALEQLEKLDSEVRRMYVPPELKIDLNHLGDDPSRVEAWRQPGPIVPSGSASAKKKGNTYPGGNAINEKALTLQRGLIALLRSWTLLILHKTSFALAISTLSNQAWSRLSSHPNAPSSHPGHVGGSFTVTPQQRYSLETTYWSSRCAISVLKYVANEQFQLVCRFRGLFWRGAVLGCISLCLIALTYPQYRTLLEQEARSKARLQRQREREGAAEKMDVDGEPAEKEEAEIKTEENDMVVDIELEDMAQVALAEIELCLGIFSGGAAYSKYAQEYLPLIVTLRDRTKAAQLVAKDEAPIYPPTGASHYDQEPRAEASTAPGHEERQDRPTRGNDDDVLDRLVGRTTLVRAAPPSAHVPPHTSQDQKVSHSPSPMSVPDISAIREENYDRERAGRAGRMDHLERGRMRGRSASPSARYRERSRSPYPRRGSRSISSRSDSRSRSRSRSRGRGATPINARYRLHPVDSHLPRSPRYLRPEMEEKRPSYHRVDSQLDYHRNHRQERIPHSHARVDPSSSRHADDRQPLSFSPNSHHHTCNNSRDCLLHGLLTRGKNSGGVPPPFPSSMALPIPSPPQTQTYPGAKTRPPSRSRSPPVIQPGKIIYPPYVLASSTKDSDMITPSEIRLDGMIVEGTLVWNSLLTELGIRT